MKNKFPTILAALALILTLTLAITPKAYVFAGGDACSIAGNSDPLLYGNRHYSHHSHHYRRHTTDAIKRRSTKNIPSKNGDILLH